jgi:MinD-like ATPase involved in chromosome partitioning or flagellar assembly
MDWRAEVSAKVLCFASAKGGSGKTVITATIGAFLSALGKRVLLVDADAATNGLTLLYIKEVLLRQGKTSDESPEGLFEGNSQGEPSAFPLPSGVSLIPATYNFTNTENYQQEHFVGRVVRTLENRKLDFDFILLDAQAGSDFCASVAMRKGISDVVVLVAEYDPMSAAGVERLKGLFRDDLTYARTWILLNKVLPEFAKNFSDFLEVARYLSPIPWDADVVRAYARRRLALDTENGNSFTIAVMQTVRGLLGDEIEKDVKAWTQNRAEAIRQPIAVQFSNLERELGAILDESAREKGRQSKIVWWS